MNSVNVKFYCVPVEGSHSIPFAELDFSYKSYDDLMQQIKKHMYCNGFYSNVYFYLDVIPF
ncbi:hypothetical protein [Sigmofec virus UA08Rod_6404]|uniref:Uncharacterized protein n=1 Tax=Sigmofec virus UA08Rod_6404 TaxID=2929229 RepID=A0A976N0W0_9VIRU|nr:hypothetical protein [Sigmofec virus UA08Rod_6404]